MLADSPRADASVEGARYRSGDLESSIAGCIDVAVCTDVKHVTVRVRHARRHVDVASWPQLLRDTYIRLPKCGSRLADAPIECACAFNALYVDVRRLARTSI